MSDQFPFIAEAKKLFDPSIVNKAQRLSITAIKGKAKTAVSKSVRKKFVVTARRIAQDLKIRMSDKGDLRSAQLDYVGQRIGLINFSANFRKVRTTGRRGHLRGSKIRRLGATARVSKGSARYLAPGGFIASGTSGNVQIFQRIEKNNSRSKLRKLTGPAVPQMVSQPEVVKDFTNLVEKEFPPTFESKLNFVLGKIGI